MAEEQSFLSELLATILIDAARAQNESNKYSAVISEEYKKDKVLGFFPVPNAFLPELEVELKFSIGSLDDAGASPEENTKIAAAVFNEFAEPAAIGAINIIRDFIEKLKDFYEDKEILEKIKKNLQSERFLRYTAGALSDTLFNNREYILDSKNKLNLDEARKLLSRIFNERLLNHPDITNLYKYEKALKNKVSTQITRYAHETAEKLQPSLNKINLISKYRRLGVKVASKDLEGLSDKAVSTLKVKVDMRNYKWVINEENGVIIHEQLLATE